MQSSRAPLFVFCAAFFTFLLAFTTLLLVLKPKIEAQRARELAAAANPGKAARPSEKTQPIQRADTEPAIASLAPHRASSKPEPAHATGAAGATGAVRLRVSGNEAGNLADATVELIAVRRDAGHGDPGHGSASPGGSARDGSDPADPAQSTQAPANPAARATTGSDGTAVLRGIERGSYRVRVHADDHADAETAWRFDGIGRNGTDELAFVLLPLSTFVHGTAIDVDQCPVSGGSVVARLLRPPPPAAQEWSAELAHDGSFQIGPLPRGTFELELRCDGMVQQSHVYAESDGETIEIVAVHGGVIVGHFDDAATLTRAPTLTLWSSNAAGRTHPVTTSYRVAVNLESRTFRIEGVGPGRYVLRAAADGYAAARSTPFDVVIGQASDPIAITLREGGHLTGTLIGHRGDLLAKARITAFEGLSPPPAALAELFPATARASTWSDESGVFELSSLAPGTQVLVIEASGQPPRTFGPFWIEEGAASTLGTLALGGGAVLAAALHDHEGRVVAAGRARLTSEQLGVDLGVIADDQGNLCLRGLAPGDYWLTPSEGGEPTAFTLASGETYHLELPHASR